MSMRTIDLTLHEQGLAEVSRFQEQMLYKTEQKPMDATDKATRVARSMLNQFIGTCTEAAKHVATDAIMHSIHTSNETHEHNYWSKLIKETNTSLMMQGEAIGLTKATTKSIITASWKNIAH